MKAIFLQIILMFISGSSVFCQCTQSGLRIQSQVCDSPKNLIVNSISCTQMSVKWLGNEAQTYILKAVGTNLETKIPSEAKTSQILCDKYGNCTATVFVKESSNVSWSVQAVCLIENATFYSAESKGADAKVPLCEKENEIIPSKEIIPSNDFHVYPNPSTGYLIVDYSEKPDGNIGFRIYDVSGKKVFKKFEGGTTKVNSSYKLDISNLLNGMYLLEINNGKKTDLVKFELLKN